MVTRQLWTQRTTLRGDVDSVELLVGYDVEARDGHIGRVDKASQDTGRQYLVVDTGFWIFGKKRMIPIGVIERVDHDRATVHVSMTKVEIKQAPDYDDTRAHDEADYDRFASYYDKFGW